MNSTELSITSATSDNSCNGAYNVEAWSQPQGRRIKFRSQALLLHIIPPTLLRVPCFPPTTKGGNCPRKNNFKNYPDFRHETSTWRPVPARMICSSSLSGILLLSAPQELSKVLNPICTTWNYLVVVEGVLRQWRCLFNLLKHLLMWLYTPLLSTPGYCHFLPHIVFLL